MHGRARPPRRSRRTRAAPVRSSRSARRCANHSPTKKRGVTSSAEHVARGALHARRTRGYGIERLRIAVAAARRTVRAKDLRVAPGHRRAEAAGDHVHRRAHVEPGAVAGADVARGSPRSRRPARGEAHRRADREPRLQARRRQRVACWKRSYSRNCAPTAMSPKHEAFGGLDRVEAAAERALRGRPARRCGPGGRCRRSRTPTVKTLVGDPAPAPRYCWSRCVERGAPRVDAGRRARSTGRGATIALAGSRCPGALHARRRSAAPWRAPRRRRRCSRSPPRSPTRSGCAGHAREQLARLSAARW